MLNNISAHIRPAREMIKNIIRQKSASHTVQRPITVTTDEGHIENGVEEVSWGAYLYEPGEARIQMDFGKRLTGDLFGLTLDGELIEHGDRLSYAFEEYEVDTISPVKDGDITDYHRLSLVKRQD